MRALLPTPAEISDLHEVYARDWIDEGGVRVNFVASVDGAVALQGRSRGLQTPGDTRVFAVLRDLADVVLVGAGTARQEGYRPVIPDDRRREARARFGVTPLPPIALVSARLDIDPSGPLFAGDDRAARPIVITHAGSPDEARSRLADVAEVIVAGEHAVDLASARDQLNERGLRRVLCEGGPTLFGRLLAQQVATELCLSVSPLLAGTGAGVAAGADAGSGAGQIVGGEPWPDERTPRLSVLGLLEEDDAFFYRYRID